MSRVAGRIWLLALAAGCGGGAGGAPPPATTRTDAGRADAGSGGSADVAAPTPPAADAASPTPPGADAGLVDVGDQPPAPADAAADAAAPDTGPGGPPSSFIPRPTGPCPMLGAGMMTFRPGGATRQARVWMSEAARTLDGPLVLYWYGTYGTPAQAEQALGANVIGAITAAGGLVVAPVHDPAAGMWPWFLVSGTRDDDLRLADEIVGCAIETVGIDRRRIHSLGFSAGAIQTVQMSYRRSGYLASVVTYSGAKGGAIPDQDPGNKLAALIFHGGPNDRVGIGFQMGSERYKADLEAAGRFAVICNHGLGHRMPTAAVAGVWRFFQDHPLGTSPSPYAQALPPELPSYCMR